jgi:metallo-beta-lactamase class B
MTAASATLFVLAVLALVQASATFRGGPPKDCSSCEEWNAAIEPFHIFGNTYYVGVAGLSAVLIASDEHFDHVGGIAALQRASGAPVAHGAPGARALMRGMSNRDDPQYALGRPPSRSRPSPTCAWWPMGARCAWDRWPSPPT